MNFVNIFLTFVIITFHAISPLAIILFLTLIKEILPNIKFTFSRKKITDQKIIFI